MNKICGNCMLSDWCANKKKSPITPCSGYVRKTK